MMTYQKYKQKSQPVKPQTISLVPSYPKVVILIKFTQTGALFVYQVVTIPYPFNLYFVD